MAKKNNWNADEMKGSLIGDMEDEVKRGYQEMAKGGGAPLAAHTPAMQPATDAGAVTQAAAPAATEPTKGVQANLPISLYNRMKRLKFETDESFQSMFQRAMELFLDVEEGRVKVSQPSNNPINQ